MDETNRTIRRLIAEDRETVPLPSLKIERGNLARLRMHARRDRVPNAAALLIESRSAEAAEFYLWELLAWTGRQVGGSTALSLTFAQTVADLEDELLDALPKHAKVALRNLAVIAADHPVLTPDYRLLAHALAIDGALARWLKGDNAKAPSKPPSAQRVYRRLAQENHPDRGGNAEVMAAVNELWRAVKQST